MEFCTKAVLDNIYVDIKEYGLDEVAKMIKSGHYEKYYDNEKDKWVAEYNDLITKYYLGDKNLIL